MLFLIGIVFWFYEMKKLQGWMVAVVAQCEGTNATVHVKMVKIVTFMLCICYQFLNFYVMYILPVFKFHCSVPH